MEIVEAGDETFPKACAPNFKGEGKGVWVVGPVISGMWIWCMVSILKGPLMKCVSRTVDNIAQNSNFQVHATGIEGAEGVKVLPVGEHVHKVDIVVTLGWWCPKVS